MNLLDRLKERAAPEQSDAAAYLLRSPGEKRKAWDDLKFAMGVCPPKALS